MMTMNGSFQRRFDFCDACFDLVYSGPNSVLLASGDGFIYNIREEGAVSRACAGHTKECVSVDGNADVILSGGWDGSVLMFDRQLRLLNKRDMIHRGACHQVLFHPLECSLYCTVGGDGRLVLADLQSKRSNVEIKTTGHPDVLCVDWNKYAPTQLACGSADGIIRLYDYRKSNTTPMNTLRGHRRAVKRLQFSPFNRHYLVSVSYDMTIAQWDCESGLMMSQSTDFTEFVTGLDHSVHTNGDVMIGCWDETVRMYKTVDSLLLPAHQSGM